MTSKASSGWLLAAALLLPPALGHTQEVPDTTPPDDSAIVASAKALRPEFQVVAARTVIDACSRDGWGVSVSLEIKAHRDFLARHGGVDSFRAGEGRRIAQSIRGYISDAVRARTHDRTILYLPYNDPQPSITREIMDKIDTLLTPLEKDGEVHVIIGMDMAGMTPGACKPA